ncbi:MAG: kelch repeat-containing protein [bacterium]
MKEFRFILGRRALIVFLALLVATGAFLRVPAAIQTLAESPLLGSQEVSTTSADASAGEAPIFDPSRPSPLLQGWSGDTWTLVPTTIESPSSPSARNFHAMVATPSGALLFGGLFSSLRNDTWLFNTSTNTWSLLNTGSDSPSARYRHAMATTPSGVLLFGGVNSSSTFGDTWLFNTATGTWSQLFPTTTPSARVAHAMAATPSGVLLFGGESNNIKLGDTWFHSQTTPPPPAPMPGMSPWALSLLSLALLGAGGWWFSRRTRLA